MTTKTTNKFSPEVRERAVRMPVRTKRDAELRREIQRVFDENLRYHVAGGNCRKIGGRNVLGR